MVFPIITMLLYFKFSSFSTFFMIETNLKSLRLETNIAKMLDRAVNLFKESGLTELAEKWEKILKNYANAKGLR